MTLDNYPLFSLIKTSTGTPTSKHLSEVNTLSALIRTEKESQHHGADTSFLFFIILAVIIGALTRLFLRKTPIPFTALLLLTGIGLGVISRLGGFETWGGIDVSFIKESLDSAAHIDPHLLLYIFLPILIFEAAFAMDLHVFKRSAGNAIILAVPGIIVALGLSALLIVGLDYMDWGLSGWSNWNWALMFGAVISATDPVAVVALLKELGASKKLSTLIEGESLLNDGTAIVIFMVFFGAISGETSEMNGFLRFIIVSFGGILVGAVIGGLVIKLLDKVFNDAMVEISLVVASTYLTFYLAEHFLHVSGVLALVTLGLMIGGVGRASISPKVEHFMSEFWELAGFIANCMIFLIVGVIVATRTNFTFNDFIMLGVVYIGINIVRAIVLAVFYPLMRKTGYGLSVKDATVVWYGALRGAIGLAMALIVMGIDNADMAHTMGISIDDAEVLKEQFLFLTAGIVTLTLLINATTIKALIKYLGLLEISPVRALAIRDAKRFIREADIKTLTKIKNNRYLKTARWEQVTEYIPYKNIPKINVEKRDLDILPETRLRLLEREKISYHHQYSEGTLSAKALPFLIEATNILIDKGGYVSLADRKDLEEWWKLPKGLEWLSKTKLLQWGLQRELYRNLSVSQDVAIAFIKAQEDCLSLLKSMARSEELPLDKLHQLEEEINMNKIQGQVYIRNLRKKHPELFSIIATRQAVNIVMHHEEKNIEKLLKKGQIDEKEAVNMRENLQERRKRLVTESLKFQ